MSNIVDTVEDRIQNAVLTTIYSTVASVIELASRSLNESSGRDASSVTAISERGEHSGITVPFENESERNSTLHMLNTNDDTGNEIPDEVSEMSVPHTYIDRQPHTHHIIICSREKSSMFFSSMWNVSEDTLRCYENWCKFTTIRFFKYIRWRHWIFNAIFNSSMFPNIQLAVFSFTFFGKIKSTSFRSVVQKLQNNCSTVSFSCCIVLVLMLQQWS